MEVRPYLVAKPFYRLGKNLQPGDIVFLNETEAAHLASQRMLGSALRQTETRLGRDMETAAIIQPEKRGKRGRPRKTG